MENEINIHKPVVQTKNELMQKVGVEENKSINPEIEKQANEIVESILALDEKDLDEQQKFVRAISSIGRPIQEKLAQQSQILKEPIQILMNDTKDGGAVAQNLLSLQSQVNEINPNRVDFTMSTIRRLLAKIPAVGTPLAKWFAKYQAISAVIDDIVKSLKDGKSKLERDNTTLQDDQIRMRKLIFELQDYIALTKALDQKLEAASRSTNISDEKRKFFEEELLFPLKQRIMDLQQQLAVNQQGVIAMEVIIRNNKELITGVQRALNVTTTALSTAATLQVALQRQKKVLEGVEAVTDTTNELIAGTAEQLRTQGTEIQKRAASAQLDIEMLKRAFNDVQMALDDISSFRRGALPEMANSIVEMDKLSSDMQDTIEKMEKGNEISDEFILEITHKDE